MSEQPELFPAPPDQQLLLPTDPTGAGGTQLRVKRPCNGCGNTLRDATDGEIQACVAGTALPDIRDQCPTCTPT